MIYRISLCLILISIFNALCQICDEDKLVSYVTTDRRWRSEREQYRDKCWWGSCTKTRIRMVPYDVNVTRQRWQTVQVCCTGYSNENSEGETLDCKPICMPSCWNGFCESPGKCACNEGYVMNIHNRYTCLPHCDPECEYGVCFAPNHCECSMGYSFINETCQPVCSSPCEHGTCIAPETCGCLPGYQTSSTGFCEPYCGLCNTGSHCTAPYVCSCDEGYESDSNGDCIPVCSNCQGGTCTAPNNCECPAGYELTDGICQPSCPGCEHGHCDLPFECTCDPGYVSELTDFVFSCLPNCTKECRRGKCVAPERCACDPGFELNESCDPVCCVPQCYNGCMHGTCLEPGLCLCDTGYVMNVTTLECVAKCDYDCGYGECIGPNLCNCEQGYGQNETEEVLDEPLCKPICKNCEGTCVAPNECVCDDDLYTAVNLSLDDRECDCFENCSEESIVCEKTICRVKLLYELTYNHDALDISTTTSDEDEYREVTEFTEEVEEDYTTELYVSLNDAILFSTEVNSHLDENINVSQEKQKSDSESSTPVWVYYVLSAVLVVLAAVALIILIKKLGYFGSGSYVVESTSKGASDSSQNDIDLIVR